MMAELVPPWGKFGHPSGQVRQGLLLNSQNFCSWICRWPRKCYGINLTHGLSELVRPLARPNSL